MPIYEYRCDVCGACIDRTCPVDELDRPTYCSCGHEASRVYSAPAIRFKGPGFHNTDYRKSAKLPGQDKNESQVETAQKTKEKADAGQSSTADKST